MRPKFFLICLTILLSIALVLQGCYLFCLFRTDPSLELAVEELVQMKADTEPAQDL